MPRPPADETEINRLVKRCKREGFEVPDGLLAMLREGEDGLLAGYSHGFQIWSVDELTRGKDHAIEIDGFFMFASDDAGTTYGINVGTGEVLGFTPSAVFTSVAASFDDFRSRLQTR